MIYKEVEIRQEPTGDYFIYVSNRVMAWAWTLWSAKRKAKRIIRRLDLGLYHETISVVYRSDEAVITEEINHRQEQLENLRRFDDHHAPRH